MAVNGALKTHRPPGIILTIRVPEAEAFPKRRTPNLSTPPVSKELKGLQSQVRNSLPIYDSSLPGEGSLISALLLVLL